MQTEELITELESIALLLGKENGARIKVRQLIRRVTTEGITVP